MNTTSRLLSVLIVLVSASVPAYAQTLALTYQLDRAPQTQPMSSSKCSVSTSTSCTQQESLGRYSRQAEHEQNVSRYLAPAARGSAAAPRDDVRNIPALGEPTRGDEVSPQSDPEFNLKIGERPRVRQDIERRFQDAAQEARFNRNLINALGLEVIVPIQSKVHRSADPELPQ